MNTRTPIHSGAPDSGYTLLETTVAITLGVLAFGLVAGAYVFGQRQFQAYHERTTLENAAQLIVQAVSSDLYASDGRIDRDENTAFVILSPGIRYEIAENVLLRNGHPVAGGHVAVTALSIEPFVDGSNPKNDKRGAFRVSITVSARQSITFRFVVSSRRPPMWAPGGQPSQSAALCPKFHSVPAG